MVECFMSGKMVEVVGVGVSSYIYYYNNADIKKTMCATTPEIIWCVRSNCKTKLYLEYTNGFERFIFVGAGALAKCECRAVGDAHTFNASSTIDCVRDKIVQTPAPFLGQQTGGVCVGSTNTGRGDNASRRRHPNDRRIGTQRYTSR